MHPRLFNLNRLLARSLARSLAKGKPGRPTASLRAFTQNSAASFARGRPQLPFLAVPSSSQQQFRYFTTQRKRWLRYEAMLVLRYTAYIWGMLVCVVVANGIIQEELKERRYPTPPEWSYFSRMRLRGALEQQARKDVVQTDYPTIIQILLQLVERLEDPSKDGAGVEDLGVAGSTSKDISKKSEPWRRGYFEALFTAAKAAEHVEGWVRDRTTNTVWPADMVVGPSNPRPKPLPAGVSGAPREEDCEPCFPAPAELYEKLLGTVFLTERQYVDAALAYANYLEYKKEPAQAEHYHSWAVATAMTPRVLSSYTPSGSPATEGVVVQPVRPVEEEIRQWTRRAEKGAPGSDDAPSENLLTALTAYATFKARNGDVSAALPVLVALLKTCRSLPLSRPPSPERLRAEAEAASQGTFGKVAALLRPPEYPPPPADGRAPPVRDAHERCEEAALQLHIGEIMYASGSSARAAAAREEGLAWTREAVDIAEEQLHVLGRDSPDAAKAACRECLAAGLDNWATMVSRLAREAEEARRKRDSTGGGATKSSSGGWFGLWGDGGAAEGAKALDRWEAEKKVISEKRRRAQELLKDEEPPAPGVMSIFQA